MKNVISRLMKILRYKIIPELVSFIYVVCLISIGKTWRIKMIRDRETVEIIKKHGPVLYAFWHSRLLPLSYTHRGRGIVVLVSEHIDGELIAKSIKRLGFGVVRGSTTRGGVKALIGMVEHAKAGYPLAITPDGPRGPAQKVKPGLIGIAKLANIPIIPVGVDAKKKWVLTSWDRFIIPKPFTTVAVVFGEPINISELELEQASEIIECAISNMNNLAYNLVFLE